MTDAVFYSIFWALSAASIISAIAAGAVIHKKSVKNADTMKKHSALTPFHAFLIGFFIAAVLMFYPVHYTRFAGEAGGVKFIKSLLMSLLNTLQIFFLNGDFSAVGETVGTTLAGGLGVAYTVYAIALFIVAPILTFGFILTFFREAIAMFKYHFHPFTDIYVISELNESSIELAKDIMQSKPQDGEKPRKKQVVFTDVFEKNDEAMFELVSQAKRLGAICLKKDITELSLKRAKINRKLFFISRGEDENLRQALTIIKRCVGNPRYDNEDTRFYVFASSTESETLLDAVDHGNMKVRRINERVNLIIDTLMTESVFEGAIPDEKGIKHINAAITGLGTYGTELLKALCWLCQMPGYELTLHIFEAGKGKDKIESIAPELISHNDDSEDGSKKVDGEAYYRLIFHDNTDVKSNAFAEEIKKLKDLTVVFVTLGTDEQNIETAMKLRSILARGADDHAEPFPPIYTVVYSALKNEIIEPHGILGIPDDSYNNKYGIKFIGDISTRFSLKVIEQHELEKAAKACHLAWSRSTLEKMKAEREKAKDPDYVAQCRQKVDKAKAELEAAKLALDNADDEHKPECTKAVNTAEKELENAEKLLVIVSDPDKAVTDAEQDVEENERKYEKYEYFRKSSIAQSVHKAYMLKLARKLYDDDGNASPEAGVYEHMRWNAYMRSIGYCLPEDNKKRKNHIAKLHHDLIPHPLLDATEKHKDVAVKSNAKKKK